jgi:hypothetical protein
MRGKIKVMAYSDIQLRVFARNNALPLANITRITERRKTDGMGAATIYRLPNWYQCPKADEIAAEWTHHGGTFVNVPDSVVLGRTKMQFTPKHHGR